MKIFNSIEEVNIADKTAVALGTFDGIHIGHAEILRNAVGAARERGYKALCYTFSNHPLNYIKGMDYDDYAAVRLICTEDEKCRILESMGFDYLVNVPFDASIMNMKAADFTCGILKGRLNAGIVCCGFNYSYGAKAEGDVRSLARDGEGLGFELNVHDEVVVDGKTVSSTLIRRLINDGDLERCEAYLGRPFSIQGIVSHGEKLGSEIGFPTMNVSYPQELEKLPYGVYYSTVEISGETFPAISNIGVRPTVNGKALLVESHVFDFEGDAYGKAVDVKLLAFKRPEQRFASVDELKKQIARDCEEAVKFHGTCK